MRRLARAAAAVAGLLQAIGASAAPPAQPRALALEDSEAAHYPAGIRLSRDGDLVAYAVKDQIYVVPVAGGAARAVTAAGSSAWSPYWSKHGKALYFLSDRSGSNQVWKLPLDGFGEATQLTSFTQGIGQLDFSPDESRLLLQFTATDLAEPSKAPGGNAAVSQAAARKPWVITRLQMKEDAGDGYLTGDRAEHLCTLDVATGRFTQLTSGNYDESEASWSPDGRQLVFVSNREMDPDASYKTDLWLVAADNPDQGSTLARLTNDDRVKGAPAFSPDGKTIAFLVADDGVYGSPQVAVMPAAGGEVRVLTAPLDRWVNRFRFSADGQWIYFVYENLGGTQLARGRVSDARVGPVAEGDRNISGFDLAKNGVIAARVQEGNRAAEVYAISKRRLAKLTAINDAFLESVALGTKESVSFRSPDGTEVQAFVTKPPGFVAGRRYPAILNIHGGPVGQFAWGFDFKPQYFATKGYVVVEPNPRGSTGRGQDFVRANYQTWGITDYDDLIAAMDYAIAQGYADPDRLAVTGYSYGGYMTNAVITRTGRFKAAATGAGHSFIAANYGHDIYQKWYN